MPVVVLGCKGCGTCTQVCEKNAIITNAGKVVRIDEEKCDLCMKCVEACPNRALFYLE